MKRLTFVALITLAACGSSNPGGGGGPDGAPPDAALITRMEPWSIGSDWTYQITDTSTNAMITGHTKVVAYEDVGGAHAGTMAFKVTADKYMGSTTSWEGYNGDLGVRYAQQDFDASGAMVDQVDDAPYRLKVDQTPDHITTGATFSETYMETTNGTTTSKTQNWTVVNGAESVTVPAGTYTCVHYHRVDPSNGKYKDYWFTAGVGKVKETGGSQNEELMAFTPG